MLALETGAQAYKPKEWKPITCAPKDGTPILMRHPDWPSDLLMFWQEDAAGGGFYWLHVALKKDNRRADALDLERLAAVDPKPMKWARFEAPEETLRTIQLFLSEGPPT